MNCYTYILHRTRDYRLAYHGCGFHMPVGFGRFQWCLAVLILEGEARSVADEQRRGLRGAGFGGVVQGREARTVRQINCRAHLKQRLNHHRIIAPGGIVERTPAM